MQWTANPQGVGSSPTRPSKYSVAIKMNKIASITGDKEVDLLIHKTRMCLCNKYYNEVYKYLSILETKNVFFNVDSDKEYQEWLKNKGL